jgi:hypothetical protein
VKIEDEFVAFSFACFLDIESTPSEALFIKDHSIAFSTSLEDKGQQKRFWL